MWSLYVFPMHVQVSSVLSSFLPRFKNMRIRSTSYLKLITGVNVSLSLCKLWDGFGDLSTVYPPLRPKSAEILCDSGQISGIESDFIV